jgi:virginiamycin B lyase
MKSIDKLIQLIGIWVLCALPLEAANLKEFSAGDSAAFMIVGPDGALWYTHRSGPTGGVSRVSMKGIVERVATMPIPSKPWGVTMDSQGNLWFTDFNVAKIRRLSRDGSWTEFSVPFPTFSITAGLDGNLWFIAPGQIGKLSPSGDVTMFPKIPQEQSFLGTITTGPDGNLWFTVRGEDAIARMTPTGQLTLFPLREGSLPLSITAGRDGYLWFTELQGGRIGRISTKGELVEFDLPDPGSEPSQVVQGPDGNLWFTMYASSRIGRITPQGSITQFELPPNSRPSALSFGPDGNLWFSNSFLQIVRMTLGGTPINGPCTPSDTVLCIDDAPGDRRFQVEIEYETEQAGGLSGKGRAVPLSSLGVARGGLFWFFSADNPEIIVKILNGCATNQKYWAFISGGTNAGMIITVSDTVTGEVHTYYNRDLTPFAPIQDTGALSCGG